MSERFSTDRSLHNVFQSVTIRAFQSCNFIPLSEDFVMQYALQTVLDQLADIKLCNNQPALAATRLKKLLSSNEFVYLDQYPNTPSDEILQLKRKQTLSQVRIAYDTTNAAVQM